MFLSPTEESSTHSIRLTLGHGDYFFPPSNTEWFPAKALPKSWVSKGWVWGSVSPWGESSYARSPLRGLDRVSYSNISQGNCWNASGPHESLLSKPRTSLLAARQEIKRSLPCAVESSDERTQCTTQPWGQPRAGLWRWESQKCSRWLLSGLAPAGTELCCGSAAPAAPAPSLLTGTPCSCPCPAWACPHTLTRLIPLPMPWQSQMAAILPQSSLPAALPSTRGCCCRRCTP